MNFSFLKYQSLFAAFLFASTSLHIASPVWAMDPPSEDSRTSYKFLKVWDGVPEEEFKRYISLVADDAGHDQTPELALCLAKMRMKGCQISENPEKAEMYKEKDWSALPINLADMYKKGGDFPQDNKKAIENLELSAGLENQEAQLLLAKVYMKGMEDKVKQDPKKAFFYFTSANKSSTTQLSYNAEASYYLGKMYQTGNEEIAQDLKEAFRCFRMAADQGCIKAFNSLGRMYQTGNGVEKNYTQALECFNWAAVCFNPKAFYFLGKMYQTGNEIQQNFKKAHEYFLCASDLGHAEASCSLGEMYKTGNEEIAQDLEEAQKYLSRAAELKHKKAKSSLKNK